MGRCRRLGRAGLLLPGLLDKQLEKLASVCVCQRRLLEQLELGSMVLTVSWQIPLVDLNSQHFALSDY